MLKKICVETAESTWINLVKHGKLLAKSTETPKYLTSQVFYILRLSTAFNIFATRYEQLKNDCFYRLGSFLTTHSTAPTNEAIKLIEGIVI